MMKSPLFGLLLLVSCWLTTATANDYFGNNACLHNPPQWYDVNLVSTPKLGPFDLSFLSRFTEPVAVLNFQGRRFCSAFLITKKYLLTAKHCLDIVANAHKPITSVSAIFYDEARAPGMSITTEWAPIARVAEQGKLSDMDYAILELKNEVLITPVKLVRTVPPLNTPIFSVHHPNQLTKKFSVGLITMTGTPTASPFKHIGHSADIDHGSSGSPLFHPLGGVIGVNVMGICDDEPFEDPSMAGFRRYKGRFVALSIDAIATQSTIVSQLTNGSLILPFRPIGL